MLTKFIKNIMTIKIKVPINLIGKKLLKASASAGASALGTAQSLSQKLGLGKYKP